jgi:hypothetical protein
MKEVRANYLFTGASEVLLQASICSRPPVHTPLIA